MKELLPPLTHLQFLVLDEIGTGKISGVKLRTELGKHGIRKSAPSFYQLMARLEESKFVEGWYVQTEVEGQPIKERHYKLTGKGLHARQKTVEFYLSRNQTSSDYA